MVAAADHLMNVIIIFLTPYSPVTTPFDVLISCSGSFVLGCRLVPTRSFD